MVESKLHHYKNWIFDWSGTLVDDLAMVLDATNHVLRNYGKDEMEREDFRMSFRLPYAGYYEEILPGVPLEELEDHFREGFAHSEASGVTSPLLPYALEFLECLHAKDKRMFILSSMDESSFERHVVELGIDHFFEATYAGVLDKRDQIHVMLEKHSLESADTVFLGDMCHDIETAKHGGLASVALLTGYQNAEQLQTASPDLLVDDLSDIHQLIEKPGNHEK